MREQMTKAQVKKANKKQTNRNYKTRDFSFFIKNTKHNHSSASDWWESTKSSFKEDDGTFSENSRKY